MAVFSAVVTTGIYCCPKGCSGRPKEQNRRWFDSAAAAEAAGFRACHLCRPYRTQPGWWLDAPELVCRSLQLVLDGALDAGGTEGQLASRVGTSPRHLRRLFIDHVGATPANVARSSRAHFARRLLDDTDLPINEIVHLAAFGSVRQFNKVMSSVFGATPSQLRSKRRRGDRLQADGGLTVRLPFAPPRDMDGMSRFLAARAIPGVEVVADGRYRRTITVAGDPAVVEIGPGGPAHLQATLHLPHWEGLLHLVQRARRVFALDVDSPFPQCVPGTWDGFEVGVEFLVRHHTIEGRDAALDGLVQSHGRRVGGVNSWSLTHLFPSPAALSASPIDALAVSAKCGQQLRIFSRAVADGRLVLDRSLTAAQLAAALHPLGAVAGPLAVELTRRLGPGVGSCSGS